jgi:hypothetical protein
MEEFFRDLHVLATRVPNISKDWLLQTTLSGLKENIWNELELIDIKDIEKACKKEKIVKNKLKAYQ